MRQFLSKLLAGGLSAAVILLWWPHFFTSEGADSWFIRGLAWTLLFELLLLALTPLETVLWQAPFAKRLIGRGKQVRARMTEHPSMGRRLWTTGSLALAAVALPVALIATSGGPVREREPRAKVIKQVEVKRPVKVIKKVEINKPVKVIREVQVVRQPTIIRRESVKEVQEPAASKPGQPSDSNDSELGPNQP